MNYIFYLEIIFLLCIASKYQFTINGSGKYLYRAFGFIICLWILMLYYTSVNTADANSYQRVFEWSEMYRSSENRERLLYIAADMIRRMTNNYSAFRCFCGLFYLLPIVVIINGKYKNVINRPFLMLLVMIYPFFISIGSLSYTISTAFVILAYYYYIVSGKRAKAAAVSNVLLIIAAGFHDASVFYCLIFWVYVIYVHSRNKKNLVWIFIILDICTAGALRLKSVYNYLQIHARPDLLHYFMEWNIDGFGFLISVSVHLLYVFLIRRKYKQVSETGEEVCVFIRDILYLNDVMLLILPLYVIHVIFFRFFRGILLLNFVCYSIKVKRKSRFEVMLLIAIQVFLMLYDSGMRIMTTAF